MLNNSKGLLTLANKIIRNHTWVTTKSKICSFPYKSNVFTTYNFCTVNNKTVDGQIDLASKLSSSSGMKELKIDSKNVHLQLSEETEDQKQKQKESAWRTMKYTLFAFGASFTFLGGYLLLELGKPPVDEFGNIERDEYSDLSVFKQYLLRTVKELNYYKKMIREPSREKLLPDPLVYPYYQPPFTLVMELTDVLVHPEWTYMTGWRFKKRPGINHFLECMNGVFEVVIFTAEQGMTVFPIIEALDPNNIISYKLVRDSTHFVDGHHVKNLSRLNRDLNKVIVIDWNSDSVKFHPDNMLRIPRWDGKDDDSTLIDLTAFLQTIATSDVEDVREVLRHYKEFENPLKAFREKQRFVMEQEEATKRANNEKEVPIVKRWAPTLLRKNV